VIGILGGRFDPPQHGHVALARAALEQLPIERLVVLVAERPHHREVVADAQARLLMAEAAFAGLGPVEVVLDPHPFTVDTVRGGRFGNAVFVVGADEGAEFESWKDPDEVLRWVRLAVGTRSGYPQPELERFGDRVSFFDFDSPVASSTEVRERVARGELLDDLVPSAVAAVIEELGLYR
jgi:nicotinate-nucleotide adenylyltransferase